MSDGSNKALVVEWTGLGTSIPFELAEVNPVQQALLEVASRAGNKPPQDRLWSVDFTAFTSDLPDWTTEGVFLDIWLRGDNETKVRKIGTFVDVGPREESSAPLFERALRPVSIDAAGYEIWRKGVVTPIILVHPYIPRLSCSLPLSGALSTINNKLAQSDFPTVTEDQWDTTVYSFSGEVDQRIKTKGGLLSTSGLTTSHLYGGRDIRVGGEIVDSTTQAGRDIENLIAQDKIAWGVDESDPDYLVNTKDAYRLQATDFELDSQGVQEFKFQASGVTNRQRAIVYAGNETTVAAHNRTPDGDDDTYATLWGLYGSSELPRNDVQIQSQFYTRPPSAIGRYARLWIVDQDDPNPFATAELVDGFYLGAYLINSNHTGVDFQWESLEQWTRRQNSVPDVDIETPDPLAGTSESINRPFDVTANLAWFGRIISSTSNTREVIDSQWAQIGSFAFPRAELVEMPQSESIVQRFPTLEHFSLCNLISLDNYESVRTEWDSDRGKGENYSEFEFWDGGNRTTDLVEDIPDSAPKVVRLFWGIGVGDRDEGFEYGYEDGEFRQISFDGAVSGSTVVSWWDAVANEPERLRPVTSRSYHSYLTLASRFDQPWDRDATVEIDGSDRRASNLMIDGATLVGITRPRSVYSLRHASWQTKEFRQKTLYDFAQDSEPCHIFQSPYIEPIEGVEDLPASNSRRYHNLWRGAMFAADEFSSGERQQITRIEPSMFCSLADAILTVLMSTGTWEWDGQFKVKSGENGPWDVAPKWAGFGIPMDRIDVDQIRNYEVITQQMGADFIAPLHDLPLTNLTLTYEDADDLDDYLEKQLLRPYGLALVTGRDGRFQIATMDGFSREVFNLFDTDPAPEPPGPNDVPVVDVIRDTDLHVDNPSDVPEIPYRSKSQDLIQLVTNKFENDPIGHIFDNWRKLEDAPLQPGIHNSFIPEVTWDRKSAYAERASQLQSYTIANTAPQGIEFELVGSPWPVGSSSAAVGNNARDRFYRALYDISAGGRLPGGAGRFSSARRERIQRWSVARPELRIELSPLYPTTANPIDPRAYDAIVPGAQTVVELSNVTGIDGGRGVLGVVLITSVSRDILSGAKICIGRLISLGVPNFDAPANIWALSEPIVEMTNTEIQVQNRSDLMRTTLGIDSYSENDLPLLTTTEPMAIQIWDRNGQVIDSDASIVSVDYEPNSTDPIVFNLDPPVSITTDAKWVAIKPTQDSGPSKDSPHRRGNAHFDPDWKWE